jgi:hypothetical protein
MLKAEEKKAEKTGRMTQMAEKNSAKISLKKYKNSLNS